MNRSMDDKDSPTNGTMFLNLLHDYHQSPPHSAEHHHLTTTTSDESNIKKQPITTANDLESSFEVVRRPRGRPPGSKNKQKPPVSKSSNKEPETRMTPYVLEVSDGSDVIAAITKFCRHQKTGLCVLSGSGNVCNVSIQQPTVMLFRGSFSLVSISATVLPPSSPISTMHTTSNNNDLLAKFVVSLSGPEGRMFGGAVIGPLIASGPVHIIAATFNNPIYHCLPRMEDDDDHISNFEYASVSATIDQSPTRSGGGDSMQHQAALPLSMYGGHFPTDVIRSLAQTQAPPNSSLY